MEADEESETVRACHRPSVESGVTVGASQLVARTEHLKVHILQPQRGCAEFKFACYLIRSK